MEIFASFLEFVYMIVEIFNEPNKTFKQKVKVMVFMILFIGILVGAVFIIILILNSSP